MKVRLATPADVPAILAIERASDSAAHWTEDAYTRLWTDSGISRTVLVAEVPEIAGFAVVRNVAGEWELENIAVAKEFRRRGVASALMQSVLGVVAERQGFRLILEVRESNHAARGLYERHGLRALGRRHAYYQNPVEDAILYETSVLGSV